MDDRAAYLKFLEESLRTDVVPDEYIGINSGVRTWKGDGPLPTVSDQNSDVLNSVVEKILKKEPDADGAEDVTRDEVADGEEKTRDLWDDEDEEEAVAPKAEKKGDDESILEQLGVSLLDLLESDDDEEEDENDDEDEDEEDEEDDDDEDEDEEKKVDDKEFEISEQETKVIEQLISEMSLMEEEDEEDEDDLNDDVDLDDEDDEDEEDEDGDEEDEEEED